MAKYVEILYRPMLTSSWQVPIGAQLEHDDGRVEFVPAALLPSSASLGSLRRAVLVQDAVRRLQQAPHAHATQLIGDHVRAGSIRRVPPGVDAVAWLRTKVLPFEAPRLPRRMAQSSDAQSFFHRCKVSEIVHQRFEPNHHLPGQLPQWLPSLSHWVGGPRAALLMDVVAPEGRDFRTDLAHMIQRVSLYVHEADKASVRRTQQLQIVGVVLPGASSAQRALAHAWIGERFRWVDAGDMAQRVHLRFDIRKTHEASVSPA